MVGITTRAHRNKASAPVRANLVPRRRRTRLAGVGWAYLGVMATVLAAALIRDINLLLVLFCVLAGLLLLNWRFVAVTLRGVVPTRIAPARVTAGQPFDVTLELSNSKRGGCWMLELADELWASDLGTGAGNRPSSVLIPEVAAQQAQRVSYRTTLSRRGRYRFSRLRVRTEFPLGLVVRSLEFELPQELLVLPRIGRLGPVWQRHQRETWVGSRDSGREQGVLDGDFHGMRPWRAGDSQRWIHWRTTARRGELMVRQFEQQRSQDLAILLHLPERIRTSDAVEGAVSLAATLVVDACRRGAGRLVFGVSGQPFPVARGTASGPLLDHVLESLALAQGAALDEFARMIHAALERIERQTRLVLISAERVDWSLLLAEVRTGRRQAMAALSEVLTIDATRGDFAEFFQEA